MRRTSLVPAALLAVIVLGAAPADAGGPTSVLLSVPGAASTTSLYYTDAQYDELSDLVGVTQPDGTFADDTAADGPAGDDPAAAPTGQRGAGVTLTWLIHDVEPWRVDRVVLAKDGPWISTQIWSGTRTLAQSPVVWHRPADPAGFVTLLARLGLDMKAAQEPGFDGVPGAPVPEESTASEPGSATGPAQSADQPAAAARPEESAWAAGAAWALVGLAVGALITWMVARRTLAARSPQPERPLGLRSPA